jgi:hypothetical protein
MARLSHINVIPRALAVVAAVLLSSAAHAQQKATEADVKVAYLFNFAKFTEWPPAVLPAGGALTICVLGDDDFGVALTVLETKTVQGRTVRIRRGLRAEDVRGCHVLYFGVVDERMAADARRMAETHGTLTLGDSEGFVERGGMVALVKVDNRIAFDVNVEATQRANLKLSSQVLKLARIVRGKPS